MFVTPTDYLSGVLEDLLRLRQHLQWGIFLTLVDLLKFVSGLGAILVSRPGGVPQGLDQLSDWWLGLGSGVRIQGRQI